MSYEVDCWDALDCTVKEDCPAFKQKRGRLCFSIDGTLCRGEVQGTYREKINQCREGCTHYRAIMDSR